MSGTCIERQRGDLYPYRYPTAKEFAASQAPRNDSISALSKCHSNMALFSPDPTSSSQA